MQTRDSTHPLHVVDAADLRAATPRPDPRHADPVRADYWARVQALRDDLARLRPAT